MQAHIKRAAASLQPLRAAAAPLPLVHIRSGRRRGEIGARLLGSLGARRQRRDDQADQRLGAAEPRRSHRRLHERRQQIADHCGSRGAGENRA